MVTYVRFLVFFFEYENKHKKIFKKEYKSLFEDYRHIGHSESAKYVNNKLNKPPILDKLGKLDLIEVGLDFHATSLYLKAISDKSPVYPKKQTDFAFAPLMTDIYVEAFDNQNVLQDGNESAILKFKYNLPDLITQHIPIKEIINNIEVNRMRNAYIIDNLTSMDILKIVKTGGRVIQIYEGVNYRENFKTSPFRKIIEKWFAIRQKFIDKGNDLLQRLVKLIMNSLHGDRIRKDFNGFYNW